MIEILITVLIIGILAAVSTIYYIGTVEDEYLNEAQSQVQAIASAERMYYLSNKTYDTSNPLNNSSPLVTAGFLASQNWGGFSYNFSAANSASSPTHLALATRKAGAMTTYQSWQACVTQTGSLCGTSTSCSCP